MDARHLFLSAALFCPPARAVAQNAPPPDANRYVVSFDTTLASARVTAAVTAVHGRLSMAGWGADLNKRGWGEYIRDLRVVEADGSSASYRPDTASAAWQLTDTTTRRVRLAYSVDLSFARTAWPYGNEQAGWQQGRDLFVVSKALFITTAREGPRTVEIRVPAGWHVAAPWRTASTDMHVHVAADDNALINNSLVVGSTAPVEVHAGNFTFLIATLSADPSERGLVADALMRVVREYVRIFPRTPPTTYVLTLFRAAERDAEAYLSSAAFSEVAPLSRINRIQWAGTVAHELFHSWNGAALRPEPYADLQWFSEGFTDYYATRSLARTGVIGEPLFRRRMERTIALYLYFRSAPAFDGVTLKAAGQRKGFNRLGVYEGGWVAAFCLDVEIRTRTARRRTLDDVMRLLYERFALRSQPYTESDLRAAFRDVEGPSSDQFIDTYVVGNATIPVDQCVAEAGYTGFGTGYQGEYFVEPVRQSAYRRSLFSHRSN